MPESASSPVFCVWLTGLPGAGKSTLAHALAAHLGERGLPVEVLDSGRLRQTPVGARVGFSRRERDDNVRRLAWTASLLARNGVVPIVAAVSPFAQARAEARAQIGHFVEVHVATAKATCIDRDTRGIWQRALRGDLPNFTGVDDPYEPPPAPEVVCDLGLVPVDDALAQVLRHLHQTGALQAALAPHKDEPDSALSRLLNIGYRE
jgi:adenylylsulfate kinase